MARAFFNGLCHADAATGLTAFGLPPNRSSEDEAFIGVTLFLYVLGVEELSAIAAAGWRIGAGCFHAKIKGCKTWEMGQINTWANASAAGAHWGSLHRRGRASPSIRSATYAQMANGRKNPLRSTPPTG